MMYKRYRATPDGSVFIRAFPIPGATSLSFPFLRFCLVDLLDIIWRWPGERRKSLPVPVILKRFATDFLVFCLLQFMGTGEPTVWPTPCKERIKTSASGNRLIYLSPISLAKFLGCPTWIRTMAKRVRVVCATTTPSGNLPKRYCYQPCLPSDKKEKIFLSSPP